MNIMKFLQEHSIDVIKTLSEGCNGTYVNTGRNGGTIIIRLLAEKINKPLQWFIVQLYMLMSCH